MSAVKAYKGGVVLTVEPGPDVGKFIEGAKASGMRETKYKGCGCFLLTRSESNYCPPCRELS